jgi:hypothetical protein
MLEIDNVKQINKGALVAVLNVRIVEWKITLYEIKVFQKGENRWLGMPCKEVITQAGEKKYFELVQFDRDDDVKTRFRDEVLAAFDKYSDCGTNVKTASPIKSADDVPF